MVEPPDTVELLVNLKLDQATGSDLCRWAITALKAGCDGTSLRRLAGLDVGEVPTRAEAEPLLNDALIELGLDGLKQDQGLFLRYERLLAERLLRSERPVAEILELMHSGVVHPLGHAWAVQPWCFLWEGNDPYDMRESPEQGEIERSARRYAREVLEGDYPTPLAIKWTLRTFHHDDRHFRCWVNAEGSTAGPAPSPDLWWMVEVSGNTTRVFPASGYESSGEVCHRVAEWWDKREPRPV
jgi:hypothetical protein